MFPSNLVGGLDRLIYRSAATPARMTTMVVVRRVERERITLLV